MKSGKLFSASLLTAALFAYGTSAAETLTLVIEDIREASGTVNVQILAGQAQFDGEAEGGAPARQLSEAAAEGSITLTIEDLPLGEYAVRIMHDVNGNGELDSNFVGIPSEPFAFSNNARGSFGPPDWEAVRFTVEGETTQVIRLNH